MGVAQVVTFNEIDEKRNSEMINNFPTHLIKNVFNIDEKEPTSLIAEKDKFFIVEVTKTENIQRKINDKSTRKEILSNLEKQTKRKLLLEIIDKINKNNFTKTEFD